MDSRNSDDHNVYRQHLRIGEYCVDLGALTVHGGAAPVRLKPKAMAVLIELARRPGATVTRDELLDRVWRSSYTTPSVVGHAVSALRRAFGESPQDSRYIETIPRLGYRLLAPAEFIDPPVAEAADAEASPPDAGKTRVPARAGRYRRWLSSALPVCALLAILAAAMLHLRPAAHPPRKLELADRTRVTFDPGAEIWPRLSHEGSWLAYVRAPARGGTRTLYVQAVKASEGIAIAPGQPAGEPAWSPDGRQIAYVWQQGERCELRIADVSEPRQLRVTTCPPHSLIYFDWNPADPDRMAFARLQQGQFGGTALWGLRRDGVWRSQPIAYAHEDSQVDFDPRFSPDGKRLAFRRGMNPNSDLYVMSTQGGAVTRLTTIRARISGYDWLPDGSGLVFASDHEGRDELYALRIGDRRVQRLGIVDAAYPDVANRAWALTFQVQRWRSAMTELSLPYAVDAKPRLLTLSSGRDLAAALSPDGARLAFVSDRDDTQQLWLFDRADGRTVRLTDHKDAALDRPTWSPDGERVLYSLRTQGKHELWEYHLGGGTAQRLLRTPYSLHNGVYAVDGLAVWLTAWNGRDWMLYRCMRRSTETCRMQATALQANRVERSGAGRLLLSSARRANEFSLVRESDLAQVATHRLPINSGWSTAGDELWYLLTPPEGGTALYALSLATGRTRSVARFGDIRPLPYRPPVITPAGDAIILPTVTEDSTDLAHARLRWGP